MRKVPSLVLAFKFIKLMLEGLIISLIHKSWSLKVILDLFLSDQLELSLVRSSAILLIRHLLSQLDSLSLWGFLIFSQKFISPVHILITLSETCFRLAVSLKLLVVGIIFKRNRFYRALTFNLFLLLSDLVHQDEVNHVRPLTRFSLHIVSLRYHRAISHHDKVGAICTLAIPLNPNLTLRFLVYSLAGYSEGIVGSTDHNESRIRLLHWDQSFRALRAKRA